jgi:hypothetical protein
LRGPLRGPIAKIIDHVNKLDRKDLQPTLTASTNVGPAPFNPQRRTFYCSVDSYDCSRYRLEVRAEALERPWIWPFPGGAKLAAHYWRICIRG